MIKPEVIKAILVNGCQLAEISVMNETQVWIIDSLQPIMIGVTFSSKITGINITSYIDNLDIVNLINSDYFMSQKIELFGNHSIIKYYDEHF